jgi:hypothetical protein
LGKKENTERALILLKSVSDAMKAERILKQEKYEAKLVAPPPEIRVGCDLSVEVNIIDSYGASTALNTRGIRPINILSLKNTQLQPSEIIKRVDFQDYLMIKAGHMKLTYNKKTGEIVNISGGGCPDIPYLALNMVGKRLGEIVNPELLGQTLCAFMLQKAYDTALQLYKSEQVC